VNLAAAEAALSKKQAELDDMMERIRGEVAGLEARRAELVSGIDPEHLTTYDRVLNRHNNFAIARVDSQVCQGCYMSVTAQEVNLLMQGQIVQCKSCSRLFYLVG
jgi:predicted  nucleic acid-binding Zn-ribbon protein